jgi:hypothetical protein
MKLSEPYRTFEKSFYIPLHAKKGGDLALFYDRKYDISAKRQAKGLCGPLTRSETNG